MRGRAFSPPAGLPPRARPRPASFDVCVLYPRNIKQFKFII